MTPKVTALRIAIAHALAATALVGGTVYAQDAAPPQQQETTELDRIEVTGSRILRTDTETASPVQTI
ncbi:MAG TPA: hypothetical protein VHF86_01520, partial [Xanthomonadaceae bacterium]|nr:hypothetical protein [Xanthomonadaceae bacterium]